MKPRRKLLLVASVVFALWVGMMIVMYFGTVYPHRHAAKETTPPMGTEPATLPR